MRILIFSQYYQPDITAAAFRISETAELLASRGHSVTVVTAEPHRARTQSTAALGPTPSSQEPHRARTESTAPLGPTPSSQEPHRARTGVGTPATRSTREPTVHRVLIEPLTGSGMGPYLKHYLSYAIRAFAAGLKIRFSGKRFDVIWATSPPLFAALPPVFLRPLFAAPLVLDIRDIWPDTAVAG